MSEQKLRISFIGTGVMGGPMAGASCESRA